MKEQQLAACIGLDWADKEHSVHLQAADGKMEHFTLEQKPDVIHEWVAQLRQRFQGRKVAIAIEQRKGAVIHWGRPNVLGSIRAGDRPRRSRRLITLIFVGRNRIGLPYPIEDDSYMCKSD